VIRVVILASNMVKVEEEGWAQVETVYAQNADTVYLMKGVCPVIR